MSQHHTLHCPNTKKDRNTVARACLPVVEQLELREYLSFSAALAGKPGQAMATGSEVFQITTTGSVAPSAETVHAGDGTNNTMSWSPSTPPTISNRWSHTEGTLTSAPTASVTPSGGSSQTIPLTLDSDYNNVAGAATVGSVVQLPAGASTSDDNSGVAIAVDSSGNAYVASVYNKTSTSSEMAVSAYDKTGQPLSWGDGLSGTKTISFDTGIDTPTSIFLDPNGSYILVAGNSSVYGWAVARLNKSDGTYDSTFGSGGKETNFEASGKCLSVTEETDSGHSGYVVMAGYKPNGSSTQMLAVRLTAAGALDSSSFGAGGIKTITGFTSSTGAQANFVMQAPFGSDDLLVGGWSSRTVSSCTACDFAIAGLSDSDGSLDTSFGPNSNGTVTTNFRSIASGCAINGCHGGGTTSMDSDYSLVAWEDGSAVWHLYAVGSTDFTGGTTFALARYSSSGTLDTGWSTDGVQANTGGATNDGGALAAALHGSGPSDSNAELLAVGAGTYGNTSSDLLVARYNINGNLDNSFGSSGSIGTDLASNISGNSYSTRYDRALGVGWDSTDSIIIVGGSSASSSTAKGMIGLAAYVDNGQADTTKVRRVAIAAATPLKSADATAGAGTDPASDAAGDPLITLTDYRKGRHRSLAGIFRG